MAGNLVPEDDQEKEVELIPELQDIINRIKAYNVVHPDGEFVYCFMGYKTQENEVCPDCGEKDCILHPDETKSMIGGFGSVQTLRRMTNDLRDMIEETKDEDDWVDV